ncbi:MAG: TIGR03435 family protein [Acidobacteriota bacterium]|nr:TIGR03435 family protein [Acidobacteriota bacterium]
MGIFRAGQPDLRAKMAPIGTFDIVAKADEPVGNEQMKPMMRSLLADRFGLSFHRQRKTLRAYLMTVAKGGNKLHESAADTPPFRENSATGTVVRGTTMKEFCDFMAGPLQTPVVDMTGLKGRYDFVLDLRGELGLDLQSRKEDVEVLVIDRVGKPSANQIAQGARWAAF